MKYQIRAHEIAAAHKITSVGPLTVRGNMLSPDAGLLLVLEGGASDTWIIEKCGIVPCAGCWLVQDLFSTYIVSEEDFKKLFYEEV
jgi:hypothetical protein